MRRLPLIAGVASLALLSGCVGPDYEKPDMPAPEKFTAAEGNPAIDAAQWWHSLGDAELDSLVDRAMTANPDVQIALARLQEARTEEIALIGGALPSADAAGALGRGTGSDATRSRVPSLLTSGSNSAASPTRRIEQMAGFDAVWQLDLFGRYRRAIEAGIYDAEAAAEARNLVLVTVIGDVVRAYVDLRGLQMRLAILQRDIDVETQSRDFVKMRYDRGLTNELDLTLAERELSGLKAQERPLIAQRDAARNAIAALLGKYPQDLAAELADLKPIPVLPARVEPGLPLQVIERRPDIRESERRLAASTARIGVAIGALFPSVGIAGSAGSQFAKIGSGPESGSHIWSLGPSAYWPILDFGSLDAQIDIADLKAQEQLAGYKKSIVNAVRDVEDTVEAFGAQQDGVANLSDALAQGQRAVTLANQRYERGLTDYLNVVDAERQQYNLEAQLISAQQTAADDFVAVFKSLGGGWEGYQTIPSVRLPHPAVAAMVERLAEPRHDSSVK